jgi:hypothetical protein
MGGLASIIATFFSAAATQKEFWKVVLEALKIFRGSPDKSKAVKTLKKKVTEAKQECTGVACAPETKGL